MSVNAQEEFDVKYITSTEIAKDLDVSRSAMCQAIARGSLPKPIKVNGDQITLFLRNEVAPYIDAWKSVMQSKRISPNE